MSLVLSRDHLVGTPTPTTSYQISPAGITSWTPTSIKLAYYFNPQCSIAFDILVELLPESPSPNPVLRFYEDYPIYWEWVAGGGLHRFAQRFELPIDFLRRPIPDYLVFEYLKVLERIGDLYGQVAAAKRNRSISTDADHWVDELKAWLGGYDNFRRDRSVVKCIEDQTRGAPMMERYGFPQVNERRRMKLERRLDCRRC